MSYRSIVARRSPKRAPGTGGWPPSRAESEPGPCYTGGGDARRPALPVGCSVQER